jgi:hypothetical protein
MERRRTDTFHPRFGLSPRSTWRRGPDASAVTEHPNPASEKRLKGGHFRLCPIEAQPEQSEPGTVNPGQGTIPNETFFPSGRVCSVVRALTWKLRLVPARFPRV